MSKTGSATTSANSRAKPPLPAAPRRDAAQSNVAQSNAAQSNAAQLSAHPESAQAPLHHRLPKFACWQIARKIFPPWLLKLVRFRSPIDIPMDGNIHATVKVVTRTPA
jgi:hypothetical protein